MDSQRHLKGFTFSNSVIKAISFIAIVNVIYDCCNGCHGYSPTWFSCPLTANII